MNQSSAASGQPTNRYAAKNAVGAAIAPRSNPTGTARIKERRVRRAANTPPTSAAGAAAPMPMNQTQTSHSSMTTLTASFVQRVTISLYWPRIFATKLSGDVGGGMAG